MQFFEQYDFFNFRIFDMNFNMIFDNNFLKDHWLREVPLRHTHDKTTFNCSASRLSLNLICRSRNCSSIAGFSFGCATRMGTTAADPDVSPGAPASVTPIL